MSPAAKSREKKQRGGSDALPPVRHVVRRSRELLREGHHLVRKKGNRVGAKAVGVVEAAAEAVEALLPKRGHAGVDNEALVPAAETLDAAIESHFGAYRKSTLREYVEAIAWAVALALLIRSFIFEAFSIPSGSMLPTLEIGDRLFVDKISYGLYVPFSPRRFVHWDQPKRGDVIVFEFHCEGDDNDGEDYIKRVVAAAGDRIRMEDNVLWVNGAAVDTETVPASAYGTEGGGPGTCARFNPGNKDPTEPVGYCDCVRQIETVGERQYTTQHMMGRGHRAIYGCGNAPDWPLRNPTQGGPCGYFGEQAENPSWPDVVIPEGHVFVMGDNRDRSEDGRFWGLVPHDMIKGRAFVVWWAHDFSRLFSWLS